MNKVKHFINRLSIKQKWSIVSALIIIVSYALISGMLYIAVYNWLINEEKSIANRTMEEVQTFFAEQGASITIQDIQRNTALINALLEQEQTIRIFNVDGFEIVRINNTSETLKEKPSLSEIANSITVRENINGNDHFIVYEPVQIGFFQGYFELIHPLNHFHALMNYILTLFVLLGIGAVIIAALTGRAIASLLLKPILQLRNSMADIKEHGIQKDVSTVSYEANDEIGELFTMYDEMLHELKESFDRQQQFVQDASHELRTPIQAIEGHLSLIQRWGKYDEKVLDESIQTSLMEVKRMKRLMEELLMLAKNEEQAPIADVDVEKVVMDCIEELQFIYLDFKPTYQVIGHKQAVQVSEEALGQMVRNFVENAIRHAQSEKPIDITVQYDKGFTIVSIRDYGIGIDSKHLPYIFNRFYRADESRNTKKGGTGLGLSITKMFAEKYNIVVEVDSELEKGTTFTLKIPSKNDAKSP